jgi:hypothetical protein
MLVHDQINSNPKVFLRRIDFFIIGVFSISYIFFLWPHLVTPGANAARAEGLQQLLGGAEGGLHIVLQRVQEVRAMHKQALCRV